MTAEEKIRRIPLLSDIDPSVISRNLSENRLFLRRYHKGSMVHQQGDLCSVIDVVLTGSLSAYTLSENGSAVTMFAFQSGSIIGANLIFADNCSYPLNITSETGSELLHITQDAVVAFLRHHPFVMRFVKALSVNSLGMNQKISMLAQKTLRENILDYLERQSVIQGTRRIVLPISKKELADYFGVQRPSLFRALKMLKDEGVIRIDNRTISF
jgi:CRP-like cAMP-binding protein